MADTEDNVESATPPSKAPRKRKTRRVASRKKSTNGKTTRTRIVRPYPASSFEEALQLAEAIQKFASGEKVRRLTLLAQLNKSPNSSATRMLITNSSRYGLTTGSYAAEWLALTDSGKVATSSDTSPRDKLAAQFKLAIEEIEPFKHLYDQYKGKKLPSHEVMKDALRESGIPIEDEQECIDTFIVNAKYLGLLKTIAGAETLLPIDHVLDEASVARESEEEPAALKRVAAVEVPRPQSFSSKHNWSKICFYISPIGDDGSEPSVLSQKRLKQ